jgi:putative oxidoreductase
MGKALAPPVGVLALPETLRVVARRIELVRIPIPRCPNPHSPYIVERHETPEIPMSTNTSRYAPLADVVFRVATSLIFIIGGMGHLIQDDVMMARIEASPWLELVHAIGDPLILLYLSGVVMAVAGALLAIGYRTKLAALALFVALVPITFVIHIAPDHVGPLFKNVAILGALIHFMVRGAGAYSIDERVPKP